MRAYIRTNEYISIEDKNHTIVTVNDDDKRYNKLCKAIDNNDDGSIDHILDNTLANGLINIAPDSISFEHGIFYYNDSVIDNGMTRRMLSMYNDNINIDHLFMFLDNLMKNPSYSVIHTLYDFLERWRLPITEDGHFLAYKRVTLDYLDAYTKKIDNTIGSVVKMKRNMVNDDRNIACGPGLHVCSKHYLSRHSAPRIMLVKVNPKDVVKIPLDSDMSKCVCCKYTVVGEIEVSSEGEPLRTIECSFLDTRSVHKTKKTARKSKLKRGVQYIDGNLIKKYESVSEASKATGIDDSSIRKACNGERKHAGKLKWEWVK